MHMYVVLHENTQVTCMYMYLFTDLSAITVASSLIKNCGNIRVFKQTAKHCARLADVFTSSYITIHMYVTIRTLSHLISRGILVLKI